MRDIMLQYKERYRDDMQDEGYEYEYDDDDDDHDGGEDDNDDN